MYLSKGTNFIKYIMQLKLLNRSIYILILLFGAILFVKTLRWIESYINETYSFTFDQVM